MLLTIILTHLICLICLLSGNLKKRKPDIGLLLLALMLPVFGSLAVMVIRSAEKEAAQAPTERNIQPDTQDVLTSSLNVRPLAASSMVPLEDALILDSPVQRRSLILNVLNDEPADYLDVLKEAQHNDDGEVVHYATTALAEQFSIADRSLQAARKAYQEDPDNPAAIRALTDVLGDYIALGIAQGAAALARKEEYARLLQQLLQQELRLEDAAALCRTWLDLKNCANAEKTLKLIQANWPRSDELFVLTMKHAWNEGNSALARETLEQARKGGFLLTTSTRERYSVWLSKEETA